MNPGQPSWQDPREGMTAAAVAAIILGVILGGLVFRGCVALVDDVRRAVEPPKSGAVTRSPGLPAATASTAATASVSNTVTTEVILRPRRPALEPAGRVQDTGLALPDPAGSPRPVPGDVGGLDDYEVVIRTTATGTATAAATSSAEVRPQGGDNVVDNRQEYARLGVTAATAPGVLMADLQVLRFEMGGLTRPVFGVDVGLGVDIVANLQAVGAGVSLGGKAYAAAGGWTRWDLGGQGVYLGAGLRF